MPPTSLTDLPVEILEAIVFHLDPPSILSVSQTAKSIKCVTTDSPIVWRYLCKTQFRSWHSRHNIAAKLAGPLSDVDWRSLYMEKTLAELRTKELLDHVVKTQHQRITCINQIADFGYDAKEALLREMDCPDDAEDVLARRYYANAALERIRRQIAIEVWTDLCDNNNNVPLERALGAYDLFAQVGKHAGIGAIEGAMDQLAAGVIQDYPNFQDLSPRMKASTLATYLRDQGFRGVSDTSYRNLSNSFIGLVLASTTHESLPLISVAIYCALARRLGLDARPCVFPFHVYTLVYAPPSHDLDGIYRPSSSSALEYMYLDPFRSSDQVRQGDLRRTLQDSGVPPLEQSQFLTDTNTRDMVLRTARNIMSSVITIRQTEARIPGIHASWLNYTPDMDSAFYATIWAIMILASSHDNTSSSNPTSRRREYLPYLIEHLQTHFPWDLTLLEHYIIPMFQHQPEHSHLLHFVQSMHDIDNMRRPLFPRTSKTPPVKFKVGQLFLHKRYHYEAVITGWDLSCNASEDWIQNMAVDRLRSGRKQPFYHVLVCDKSLRYVAEENINLVSRDIQPSRAIMSLAGHYFKRWDTQTHCFVSNIRDEYPDD